MLTVIGCGNANRSDDGVGVFVAQTLLRRLRDHPREDVRVFDAGTGGMEVMFQARGASRLIVVDAQQPGEAPGAIYRVPGEQLAVDHAPALTMHDFRWDHALAAGRRIFRDDFPGDVTVYLIEAANLDLGLELTPAVRASALRVVELIAADIDTHVTG